MSALDLTPFEPHLNSESKSDLLQRCLAIDIPLSEQREPADAIPWDPASRDIERLKQYRPQAAAKQAEAWLEERLQAIEENLASDENLSRFCSALSTWSGIQRTLGALSHAAPAAHHALRLLSPQPSTTRTGFALQRAAYVLGDLGDLDAGLALIMKAVYTHQATHGGQHQTGIALAGLGAYQLFYLKRLLISRVSFTMALHALDNTDPMLLIGAHHGIAYSYLMERKLTQARRTLAGIRQLMPEPEPDQDLRLQWLEAEIEAADGNHRRALEQYEQLFEDSLRITEVTGPVLITFDAVRILINQSTEQAVWQRRLQPIVQELTKTQQAALEPFLDALQSGQLDRQLLDQTTVAFKTATNRMLLGMGRPGAAGRPERRGRLAA